MDHTVAIYEFLAHLPAVERHNLADQLRRAATSVPLNIAEACGSTTNREFGVFLGYAYRSLQETITGLELCQRLYAPTLAERIASLVDDGNQISRMIRALMRKASTPARS
jgi:four helix bundle protein